MLDAERLDAGRGALDTDRRGGGAIRAEHRCGDAADPVVALGVVDRPAPAADLGQFRRQLLRAVIVRGVNRSNGGLGTVPSGSNVSITLPMAEAWIAIVEPTP